MGVDACASGVHVTADVFDYKAATLLGAETHYTRLHLVVHHMHVLELRADIVELHVRYLHPVVKYNLPSVRQIHSVMHMVQR